MKMIPIKKWRIKAGRIAFKFEIPIPLITVSSEFLIKINRAKIEYTSILPYLKLDGSQKDLDGYFDEFLALGFTTRW